MIWSPSMIIPLQLPKGNPPGYPVCLATTSSYLRTGGCGESRHKFADAWAECMINCMYNTLQVWFANLASSSSFLPPYWFVHSKQSNI